MSPTVGYVLIQIIVILCMVCFCLFLLWRTEKKTSNRYATLTKDALSGVKKKKDIFQNFSKVLRQEQNRIDLLLKKLSKENTENNQNSDELTHLISMLRTRQAIIQTELAMADDLLQGKSYNGSVKNNIGKLLEKLKEIGSYCDSNKNGNDDNLHEELIVLNIEEKLESESMTKLLELSDELQRNHQRELQKNAELQMKIDILERELLEAQDSALKMQYTDAVSLFNVSESGDQEVDFEVYTDATDKLIEKINQISFKRDQALGDYESLEARCHEDEAIFKSRMNALEKEKKALLLTNKSLVNKATQIPDKETSERLSMIEVEEEVAKKSFAEMAEKMEKRKSEYTNRIKQLENDKINLQEDIEKTNDLRKKDEEFTRQHQEKQESNADLKKMIKKLNRDFEFSQENAERHEQTIASKDKLIKDLKKKIHRNKVEMDDAVREVGAGYAGILKKKDMKIKKLEAKIVSLSGIIRAMKK